MSMNWKALLITIGIFAAIAAYIYFLCTHFECTIDVTIGFLTVICVICFMVKVYRDIAKDK